MGLRKVLVGLEVEDKEEAFEGDEYHHEELEKDFVNGAVKVLGMVNDAPDS